MEKSQNNFFYIIVGRIYFRWHIYYLCLVWSVQGVAFEGYDFRSENGSTMSK